MGYNPRRRPDEPKRSVFRVANAIVGRNFDDAGLDDLTLGLATTVTIRVRSGRVKIFVKKPADFIVVEVMREETDGVVQQDVEEGLELVLNNHLPKRVIERVHGHELPRALCEWLSV